VDTGLGEEKCVKTRDWSFKNADLQKVCGVAMEASIASRATRRLLSSRAIQRITGLQQASHQEQ
jgi:hypothetical protein